MCSLCDEYLEAHPEGPPSVSTERRKGPSIRVPRSPRIGRRAQRRRDARKDHRRAALSARPRG